MREEKVILQKYENQIKTKNEFGRRNTCDQLQKISKLETQDEEYKIKEVEDETLLPPMEMVHSKISSHAWPAQARTVPRFAYTLVLDLDETLVHFDVRRRIFKVRPLCIRFLEELSLLFEIVIFTAAHESYANFILDKLDP